MGTTTRPDALRLFLAAGRYPFSSHAPWNAIDQKGYRQMCLLSHPNPWWAAASQERFNAINARVAAHQMPSSVAHCCTLRRHNPGCMRMRQQMIAFCQIASCDRGRMVTRASCRRRGSGGQLRHSTDACRDPLSRRPEASDVEDTWPWRR